MLCCRVFGCSEKAVTLFSLRKYDFQQQSKEQPKTEGFARATAAQPAVGMTRCPHWFPGGLPRRGKAG